MLKEAITILECSRVFSLPMTIMSWLVVFTFAWVNSGNIFYGLLAFLGICLAHLGTNLIDDYFDYKFLIKRVDFDKAEYIKHSQKTKCRYLITGLMSEQKLLAIIVLYFSLAFLIGLFLYFKCGIGVLYFALIGGVIGILYPLASRFCLAELAVGLAYGPALFGGVYYVMTGMYSYEVFLLSLPTMIMTIILLYIHMVMDYSFDTEEGKKTIANRFNSQLESLVVLKWLMIVGYVSLPLLCIFDILDWQVFFVYLTIPLAVDLYKSLVDFSNNPEKTPDKKWYHFPMENLDAFVKRNEDSFMFRMLQARNLMIYFSLILVVVIVLSLAL